MPRAWVTRSTGTGQRPARRHKVEASTAEAAFNRNDFSNRAAVRAKHVFLGGGCCVHTHTHKGIVGWKEKSLLVRCW